MDPGRCPECGTIVTPDRLTRVPVALRRRRARQIAALLIVAGIAFGAYIVIPTLDWPRYLPTWVLLKFPVRAEHPATIELARRLDDGTLAGSELAAFLDRAATVAPLEVISPYPKDERGSATLTFLHELPMPGGREVWSITGTCDWVTVDGKDVDYTQHSMTMYGAPVRMISAQVSACSRERTRLRSSVHGHSCRQSRAR